jgi:hypothetical protein
VTSVYVTVSPVLRLPSLPLPASTVTFTGRQKPLSVGSLLGQGNTWGRDSSDSSSPKWVPGGPRNLLASAPWSLGFWVRSQLLTG